MEKIATLKDNILGVDYAIYKTNTIDLIEQLKKSYKNIDYTYFNRDHLDSYRKEKETEMPVPLDAYEYQNFFLLEKESGEYLLLDGFRRLLWAKPERHDILVRVYKETEINKLDIIKLLVSFNHTKFFGGIGNFYDRGFALAMFTVFGVDVPSFYSTFAGYLTVKNEKYHYSVSKLNGTDAYVSTIDKIKNPSFVDDMLFFTELVKENLVEMDANFGSFIWNIRKNNINLVLDSQDFIFKVKSNDLLLDLITKFKKSKDSRGDEIGNQIFEMFTNIILNKVESKSFAERVNDCKKIADQMKKEKDWFNYTKNNKYSFGMVSNLRDKEDKFYQKKGVEAAIIDYYNTNGEYPKVKVLVMASKNQLLPEGVYDDFKIIGFKHNKHLINEWNVIIVKRGDVVIKRCYHHNSQYNLSIIEDNNRNNNDVILYIKDLEF